MLVHMVASNLNRTLAATALSNAEELVAADYPCRRHGNATLVRADCSQWLCGQAANSIEAEPWLVPQAVAGQSASALSLVLPCATVQGIMG